MASNLIIAETPQTARTIGAILLFMKTDNKAGRHQPLLRAATLERMRLWVKMKN